MPNPRKLTPNQQAYKKELNRIKQFIRRAEKRGYIFDKSIIPEQPKRITKASVQRLKSINPARLYKKSIYIDPGTGEVVPGTKGRALERSVAARKGAAIRKRTARDRFYDFRPDNVRGTPTLESVPTRTNQVLQHIRAELDRWVPDYNWTEYFTEQKGHDRNILKSMLDGAIAHVGEDAVAQRLEQNANEVNMLLQEILYGSGGGDYKTTGTGRSQINFDLTRFSAILLERSLTVSESQILTDLAENLEINN